jgi:hypothetical protein
MSQVIVSVGGIEKQHIKRFSRFIQLLEHGLCVSNANENTALDVQCYRRVRQMTTYFPVIVYECDRTCPTAQRFKPKRSRACETVQYMAMFPLGSQ